MVQLLYQTERGLEVEKPKDLMVESLGWGTPLVKINFVTVHNSSQQILKIGTSQFNRSMKSLSETIDAIEKFNL